MYVFARFPLLFACIRTFEAERRVTAWGPSKQDVTYTFSMKSKRATAKRVPAVRAHARLETEQPVPTYFNRRLPSSGEPPIGSSAVLA